MRDTRSGRNVILTISLVSFDEQHDVVLIITAISILCVFFCFLGFLAEFYFLKRNCRKWFFFQVGIGRQTRLTMSQLDISASNVASVCT